MYDVRHVYHEEHGNDPAPVYAFFISTLCAVGTLLSAMAVQTRTRDVLLPILLFPVAFSVLLAAVKASGGFLNNSELTDILLPINLLIAYDVIFIAVSFMVFDSVVEE